MITNKEIEKLLLYAFCYDDLSFDLRITHKNNLIYVALNDMSFVVNMTLKYKHNKLYIVYYSDDNCTTRKHETFEDYVNRLHKLNSE